MERGQIFSLDLVLALALLVLAVGVVFQHTELFSYNQKDLELLHELERVGESASQQLVSNPAIVCGLEANGIIIDYLNNCIPQDPCSTIDAGSLGLPDGYVFGVSGEFSCGSLVPPAAIVGTVYSSDRVIVVSPIKTIQKTDFEDCVNPSTKGSCVFGDTAKKITFSVWKGQDLEGAE